MQIAIIERDSSNLVANLFIFEHLTYKYTLFPRQNQYAHLPGRLLRAEKGGKSCAEGASEAFVAYVHMEGRFVDARLQSV